ncbi:HEAT repeat containing 5B, partial [Homo sapiens]
VQAKCYQLLLSVFQHSNRALSTPYIHSLAPIVVEKLKAVERNRPASNIELLAVQEGIKVLETLVALGEEQNILGSQPESTLRSLPPDPILLPPAHNSQAPVIYPPRPPKVLGLQA